MFKLFICFDETIYYIEMLFSKNPLQNSLHSHWQIFSCVHSLTGSQKNPPDFRIVGGFLFRVKIALTRLLKVFSKLASTVISNYRRNKNRYSSCDPIHLKEKSEGFERSMPPPPPPPI
jgi:hypothetical protein